MQEQMAKTFVRAFCNLLNQCKPLMVHIVLEKTAFILIGKVIFNIRMLLASFYLEYVTGIPINQVDKEFQHIWIKFDRSRYEY